MRLSIGQSLLEIVQGDIVQQRVDALVNAANSQLTGGSGVNGAIHSAGGPEIMAETARRYPNGCATGSAVISGGGRLPVKLIFHTVGPIWHGGLKGERAVLKAAYECCLKLALEHGCESIALPAISTGVYGYPMDLAAEDALSATIDFLRRNQRPPLVRFVLFSPGACAAFERVLEEFGPTDSMPADSEFT
jgi:O-acetyl-ADP-ribose deacetylase (regulator of RNase III)